MMSLLLVEGQLSVTVTQAKPRRGIDVIGWEVEEFEEDEHVETQFALTK